MENKRPRKSKKRIQKKSPTHTGLLWVLNTIGIVTLLVCILSIAFSLSYENVFYPGTLIGSIDVSLKTKDEALGMVQENERIFNENLLLASKNVSEKVDPAQLGLQLNTSETVLTTFSKSHSKSLLKNISFQAQSVFGGISIPISHSIDMEIFSSYMDNKLNLLEKQAKENDITFEENNILLIKGQEGKKLHKKLFLAHTINAASSLNQVVRIPYERTYPKTMLHKNALAKFQSQNIFKAPINLTVNNTDFTFETSELKGLRTSAIVNSSKKCNRSDFLTKKCLSLDHFIQSSIGIQHSIHSTQFHVELDSQKTLELMSEKINEKVKISPKNARFSINKKNELTLIEDSTSGEELIVETNITSIQRVAQSRPMHIRNIALTKKITGAQVTKENIDSLGIKELIGVGESDFAGSPQARRHNISVGTQKLTGILVAPGEEYSLLSHLGKVTAETGYLPELVIKPGKTIKEYGGGLCQLGSTIFRGAMNTGLTITERQWHSYPVEYYKPYGTDATIYDPAPDFKFLNNTKHYILIQGEMDGDILKFNYYGTSDGRSVRFDGPHYWDYGWAGPGSLKAKWTQIVTHTNGDEVSKTFWSNYKSPESFH